jgi:polyhydroxybutyrate depolymerase
MTRPALALLAILLSAGALAACRRTDAAASPSASVTLSSGRSDHTIVVSGRSRAYHLYVPAGLSSSVAVVVMLHGGFGTGAQAETSYNWDAQADQGHFVVVYPDGLDRAWAAGGGCCGIPASTGVDDVAFIKAVVESLPADPQRIYATGISNGGMLAYRLACDTALFAAIGPDSATLLGDCASPARTSVIHIHGTADHNIPYAGGQGNGFAKINGPGAPELNARWRQIDGCDGPAVSTAGVVTTSVATCPDGRAVELITIAGAGHQWPGSVPKPAAERALGLDPPSTALDATSVIWQFFAAHPKPA